MVSYIRWEPSDVSGYLIRTSGCLIWHDLTTLLNISLDFTIGIYRQYVIFCIVICLIFCYFLNVSLRISMTSVGGWFFCYRLLVINLFMFEGVSSPLDTWERLCHFIVALPGPSIYLFAAPYIVHSAVYIFYFGPLR